MNNKITHRWIWYKIQQITYLTILKPTSVIGDKVIFILSKAQKKIQKNYFDAYHLYHF